MIYKFNTTKVYRTGLCIFLFLLVQSCLPPVPPYPMAEKGKLDEQANRISSNLEEYIKKWHKGEASAELPLHLLPSGYDVTRYTNFRLVKPKDLTPEMVWVKRPAHEINFSTLYGSFPDPHCTYLLAPVLYAPFGSTLIIQGEFPYCRFFNIQVTPALDTREYRYDKWSGKGEVAIVDADIEPMDGHVNPFRVGANRLSKNRKYEVKYVMALGNPSELNVAHRYPYRDKSNVRFGSAIQLQGPWGNDKKSGHGRGIWDFGDVWIRYYAIDNAHYPDAGVPLPTLYFQLPTGEQFFIVADLKEFIKASEQTMPNRNKGNRHPSSYNGKHIGWDKQFGIFLQIATGGAMALYKETAKDKAYVRQLDLGVNGRGENQPLPASLEAHATGCNYTGYLTSGISIKKGSVFVLTGKMPTFPDTRNGSLVMKGAQCRYWSVTTYDAEFPFSAVKGLENTSVMDDEIVLDENRKYILVYSRKEDRPKNATRENGVTWVDWGNTCTQAFTLRWISVSPEWSFELTPNEENLPWANATWSGTKYNRKLVGSNERGFLKEYHPLRHYLTKETFDRIPVKEWHTSEKIIWEEKN